MKESVYRNALIENPSSHEDFYGWGLLCLEAGNNDKASQLWTRSQFIKPDFVQALTNLGNIHADNHHRLEAQDCYCKAIILKPDHISAYSNWSAVPLEKDEDDSLSRWLCWRAIYINPLFVHAYTNLGTLLRSPQGKIEAKKASLISIILSPDHSESYNNLGIYDREKLDLQKAEISWRRALVITPHFADAAFSLSLTLFAQARFQEGWPLYEERWQSSGMKYLRRNLSQPRWRGEEGFGKTLLIYEEQGYGDTLHFCRYIPLIAAKGWTIIFQVFKPLFRLMQSLDSVSKLILMGEDLPAFDAHCPLLSIPGLMRTRLETIPSSIPYLRFDHSLSQLWKKQIELNAPPSNPHLKIGLAWFGSIMDRRRSMHEKDLTPLFQAKRTLFFKLHTEKSSEQIDPRLINLIDETYDFADTAAVLSHLDLVITIDTAVAHLAAAMGIKVFLLVRFDPCWRWLRDREDSPWYPTMQIFRQSREGQWQDVIESVLLRLMKDYPDHYSEMIKTKKNPYERSQIKSQEDRAHDHFLLGCRFIEGHDIDKAIEEWQESLKLNPYYSEAHNNIGNALSDREQAMEAILSYKRAIIVSPNYHSAYRNFGILNFSSALLKQALYLASDLSDSHSHYAMACKQAGDYEEALRFCHKAIVIAPDSSNVLNNLGIIEKDLGHLDLALKIFERALAISPETIDLHISLAVIFFTLGAYEKGWPHYEWRWKKPDMASVLKGAISQQWSGEWGNGRSILIYVDSGGFGDAIQLCRFIPRVVLRGWRVFIEAPFALKRLFERLSNIEAVLTPDNNPYAYDLFCPLSRLPYLFQVDESLLRSQASSPPLFHSDLKLVQKWKEKLHLYSKGRPLIGLVLAGNRYSHDSLTLKNMDRARSIPPRLFEEILSEKSLAFVDLQKAEPLSFQTQSILNVMDQVQDFSDSADLIEALDLVITVDTAVAHLAGSLGKSVWLLDRFEHCWRWIKGRIDSPWYPSMRIFRQDNPSDWDGLLEQVKNFLIYDFLRSDHRHKEILLDYEIIKEKALRSQSLKEWDRAEEFYRKALWYDPYSIVTHNNLAVVLQAKNRFLEALRHYKIALCSQPNFFDILLNLSLAFRNDSMLDPAEFWVRKALIIEPKDAGGHFNLAHLLFFKGDYRQGALDYEWRWHLKEDAPISRNFKKPQWSGEKASKNKKRLFLSLEGGLGDIIQFCRFIPKVASLEWFVILEVQPVLVSLLRNLEGIGQIIALGDNVPDFDLYCSMGSFPFVAGADLKTLPQAPYLKAESNRISYWHKRLKKIDITLSSSFKIGIVWEAGPSVENRSIPQDLITILISTPQILWFSLQKTSSEKSSLPLIDWMGDVHDFADCAALVHHLDLIISVDTAVAHLAGAMGKKVWLLTKYEACWRWLVGRSDSPWYGSMEIFRQTRSNDWNSLLKRVKKRLEDVILEHSFERIPDKQTLLANQCYEESFKAQKEGDLQKAYLNMTQSLILTPQNKEYYYTIASYYLFYGDNRKARWAWIKIVTIDPYFYQAHTNIANNFCDLKLFPMAQLFYTRSIIIQPQYSLAYGNYSLFMKEQKLGDKGLSLSRKAIILSPNDSRSYHQLSTLLGELQNYEEAYSLHKKSIILDCQSDQFYAFGAINLKEQKRFYQALQAAQRAVILSPKDQDHYHLMAWIGESEINPEASLTLYKKALLLDPSHFMIYSRLGNFLQTLRNLTEAETIYQRLVTIKPDYFIGHNNLGIVLQDNQKMREVVPSYRRAFVIAPDHPDIYTNYSFALYNFRQLSQAINAARRSIQIDQNNSEGHHNLSFSLLASGYFKEGWQEFEWRWESPQLKGTKRFFSVPQWKGEEGQGAYLLLHSEQGYGDSLQFCRYALLAAQKGWKIILEVPDSLISIMKTLPSIHSVYGIGQAPALYKAHCPLMSLPLACGTILETIPSYESYLEAPEDKKRYWYERLASLSLSGLKVGLVWAGNPRLHSPGLRELDKKRSLDPNLLSPLLLCKGITFFSLQKEGPKPPLEWPILDFMEDMKDFSDTAALVSNLDLVIAVDTAMVHLASALGKPVWLLDRFSSCWRWLEGREDSPWYPKLRIFRQKHQGDWDFVISNLVKALENITGTQSFESDPPLILLQEKYPQANPLLFEGSKLSETEFIVYLAQYVTLEKEKKFDLANQLKPLIEKALSEDEKVSWRLALKLQTENSEISYFLWDRLVRIHPHNSALHYNRGLLLKIRGFIPEAIVAYKSSIVLQCDFIASYTNLGNIFYDRNFMPQALNCYQWAIHYAPMREDLYSNASLVLSSLNNPIKAYRNSQIALILNPCHAIAYTHLSIILAQQEDFESSVTVSLHGLYLRNDFLNICNRLSVIYAKLKQEEKSYYYSHLALALEPNFNFALCNLGNIFWENGDLTKAIRCWKRSQILDPNYSLSYSNHGSVIFGEGYSYEAQMIAKKAITFIPHDESPYEKLLLAHHALREFDKANRVADRALTLKPDFIGAHLGLSENLLTQGKFEQGWSEWMWRWYEPHMEVRQVELTVPSWEGEEGHGQRLLIHPDGGGYGDAIQFARYVPLIQARGWKVTLTTFSSQLRFFQSIPNIENLIPYERGKTDCHAHCSLLSLPYIFKTDLTNIPPSPPFYIDKEEADYWQKKLQKDHGKGPKIGIAWAGNRFTSHKTTSSLVMMNRRRSVPVEILKKLFDRKDILFFSLQKEEVEKPDNMRLFDYMESLEDFSSTAAFMQSMDMIITVDTAIVHLAASIGKKVWLLNRYDSCWRWLHGRDDSPWYPSIKIFKQPSPGEWSPVIDQVCDALEKEYPRQKTMKR
jgi:tetratricopeptide (TPR) repeat protein